MVKKKAPSEDVSKCQGVHVILQLFRIRAKDSPPCQVQISPSSRLPPSSSYDIISRISQIISAVHLNSLSSFLKSEYRALCLNSTLHRCYIWTVTPVHQPSRVREPAGHRSPSHARSLIYTEQEKTASRSPHTQMKPI